MDRIATFIHWMIGALAVIPGLGFIAVQARKKKSSGDFIKAVRLSDVASGVPLRVSIIAGRQDAYVSHPPGPIGSVWLLRSDDPSVDGTPSVRCLQTICPHLGCAVDFAPDRDAFVCPCHTSEFARSGEAIFGPSPRAMDALRCRITDPDGDGVRWVEVEYREFRTGTLAQVSVT